MCSSDLSRVLQSARNFNDGVLFAFNFTTFCTFFVPSNESGDNKKSWIKNLQKLFGK